MGKFVYDVFLFLRVLVFYLILFGLKVILNINVIKNDINFRDYFK